MDGLDRVWDPTVVGDLGFGDSCSSTLLLSSLSISRSPHLSRSVCAGCCELPCVEVFTMQMVYFKTDTSEPFWVLTTPDGAIDVSVLGLEFGLDPKSIALNGTGIPKTGLASQSKWEEIREVLSVENEMHVGTKENLVIVTGAVLEVFVESLLWTRAASTINVDDLCVLRSCFDTAPLPEEEVPLSSLLGAETEGGESFWDEDTYELQQKDDYIRQFKKMIAAQDVVWTNANATKIKKRFSNLEFPIVAKNDLVASLKRFRSLVSIVRYWGWK